MIMAKRPIFLATFWLFTQCTKPNLEDPTVTSITKDPPSSLSKEKKGPVGPNFETPKLKHKDIKALLHKAIQGNVSKEDLHYLSQFEAPLPKNSLEEALVSMYLIHLCLEKNTSGSSFDEQPTDTDQTPPATLPQAPTKVKSTLSLSNLAKEWELDLVATLRDNPYLVPREQVYTNAFNALDNTNNDPQFEAQMKELLKKEEPSSSSETEDSSDESLPTQGSAPQESVPANDLTAPPSQNLTEGAQPQPSAQELAELQMTQAKSLMDQEKYYPALDAFKQIPSDSPLYQEAQKNAKVASNRGLQELRKKAARSFQSSIPVQDKKARLVYLEEAKKWLEEGIDHFPNADLIETVKENLKVINRHIEQNKTP